MTMPWLKKEKLNTKKQPIVHKTLHKKPKTEQYKPHRKLVFSGPPERYPVIKTSSEYD